MKKYETKDLRDVAFVGHGRSGKTSLCEALLFNSKVTTRLGRVDDASSNMDTEPEEIKRKASVQCAVANCEWKKAKVNIIVTPGDTNFAVDAELGASTADAAVVVVSAPDGVQVGTERAWDVTGRLQMPRVIFINKLDRERADFEQTMKDVKEILSEKAVAMQIPIGKEGSFSGLVDLLSMKAFTFEEEGRAPKAGEVPADLKDQASEAREALVEGIASTRDELIEKYLETGELSSDEINAGLSEGIKKGTLIPVLLGSATGNIGVQPLMDLIVTSFPSPAERPPAKGKDPKEAELERKPDVSEPLSARIFKSTSVDIGKLSLMRVMSGTLTPDTNVVNATRDGKERIGRSTPWSARSATP
jgi:elongation factor G